MNLLNSFILMKRAGDKARQAEQLLAQDDLTDDEKLRKILVMGDANLVIQSGAQNFKLIMFLSKKEIVEKLVKYALGVPSEEADEDEAYKFPNVAQEYLTKSPMLLQTLVNGGQVEKKKQSNYDNSDDDDSEEDFDTDEENDKKEDLGATLANPVAALGKSKKALKIQLDDDDDEDEREDDDKKEEQDDEESAKQNVADILTKNLSDEEDDEDELEERDEDAEPEEENKENSQDAQKKDEDKEDGAEKKKGLKFQAKKIKKLPAQQAESPQEADNEKESSKEDEQEDKKVSVDKVMLQMGDDFSKTNRAAKSRNKSDAEEEDEFERDDDQTELEGHNKDIPEQKSSLIDLNDDDDAREDVDDDDDDTGNKTAKTLLNAKKTVEVYMPNKEKETKKKKKAKKQQIVVEPTQAEKNLLLDMMFSFIGVCSQPEKLQEFQRESLNLFSKSCKQSRMTAGTTTDMPGKTVYHDDFKANMGSSQQSKETPELLSVSCGYFKNIVLKMLFPAKRMEVLRYILIDTKGAVFDKLLEYSSSQYSLASLLMELMQLDMNESGNPWPYDGDEQPDEETKLKQEQEKAEKELIQKMLEEKKADIVGKLITKLSHVNKNDMEAALSASQILIDIVEIEKTIEIFFENDAKYLHQLIVLAVDCENKSNQAYLLHVLLTIAKQLKPDTKSRLTANDKGSDDDGTETERSPQNMFDKDLPVNSKTMTFLQLVHDDSVLNYLVMMLSSDNEETYENQYQRVRKFGQIRLRSLELIHCILVLLYPSKNKFAHCMRNFVQQTQGSVDEENKAADEMDNADHPFSLAKFLSTLLKRHLVSKLLNVLLNYGFCSIACQLCVQIMVQISGQYDIIDVTNLQRFVIQEFKQRHIQLEDLTRRARLREASVLNEDVTEAGSTIASQATNVAPKRINHMNMQSAQVNQMTMQLKERVELVQQFYQSKDKEQVLELTGSDLQYSDLISAAEVKYWRMLCRKDFKRLQKLMTQEMGQGHFVDDSDEFNSDSDDKKEGRTAQNIDTDEDLDRQREDLFALMYENNRRRSVLTNGDSADAQKADEDDDSFDQESFLENMLAEMRKKDDKTEEAELKAKAREMEENLDKEKKLEEQKFADNNFWRIGMQSADLNVEDLLADLDDDVPQVKATSPEQKVEDVAPAETNKTKEVDNGFVDNFLDAFEDED